MHQALIIAKSYVIDNGVCSVDGVIQSSTQQCDDALKGILGILAAIIIPLLVISLVFLVFWIIALIHAVKHQNIQNRGLWLGILIGSFFVGMTWLAAIIYYFAVMRPYKKGKASGHIPDASYPTQPQNTIVPAPDQPTQPENNSQNNPPTTPSPTV